MKHEETKLTADQQYIARVSMEIARKFSKFPNRFRLHQFLLKFQREQHNKRKGRQFVTRRELSSVAEKQKKAVFAATGVEG